MAKKVKKLKKELKIHVAYEDWMFSNSRAELQGICNGKKIKLVKLLIENLKQNLLSVRKFVNNDNCE